MCHKCRMITDGRTVFEFSRPVDPCNVAIMFDPRSTVYCKLARLKRYDCNVLVQWLYRFYRATLCQRGIRDGPVSLTSRCSTKTAKHSITQTKPQDSRIVSIKVEQEVVCALSNVDIADDLGCPLTTPTIPHFLHFAPSFIASQRVHFRDFNSSSVYRPRFTIADEKNFPESSGLRNPFQNFTPREIYPGGLRLEISNFVQRCLCEVLAL